MPLLTSLVKWLNTKRIYQIDLMRKFPFEIQQEQLFRLIDIAKTTEWGKKFGFEDIKSIANFQERVPIHEYNDLKPFIDRHRQGEKDVLWPGEIKWYAKSSGTTSDKSKFIPVSKDGLENCHFRGGKDVLAIYTNNYPNSKIFKGKGLTLGGSHKIDNFNNQAYFGDLSAILIENLPFWVDIIRTPKTEIALIDRWEEKLEKYSQITVNENVTNIAGVPSWNLVLIKYILEKTGHKHLLEIWPNLELFTHGGVSFTPYREQYQKIIPSENMHYQETYNASEGFFAIQDEPDKNDMLLLLDYSVFYEFIPAEQYGTNNPTVLSIGEVEKGKNYAMLISTSSGLWRYAIGDTVTFTSVFPHKIIITGRTKHFINAFGEEVIIDNAEKALRKACEKTGATIVDYTAGPVYMSDNQKGRHQWLIEFNQPPSDLEKFNFFLDKALQDVNSDYEAKRYKNITLEKPLITVMEKGTFYNWLNDKGKLGGQNKVPRLSNNRKYIDEILEVSGRLTN